MELPEPLAVAEIPRSNAEDFSVGAVIGRSLGVDEGVASEAVAALLADVRLSDADEERLAELCRRSQAGTLSGDEWEQLEAMNAAVGRLSLWRLMARKRLGRPVVSSADSFAAAR